MINLAQKYKGIVFYNPAECRVLMDMRTCELIQKDLQILEILKSCIMVIENKQITLGYGKYRLSIRPDVILSDDTIKIIKEWLDNGNNN